MQWFIRGNVPSLKNGKIWTGETLVSSSSTRKWQKLSKPDWQSQKESFTKAIASLGSRPYFIHLTFLFSTNNFWDFTARVETIADEMVKYQWINDDNIYEFMPVPGKPILERVNPGTIIRILKTPPIYNFL